MIIKLKTIAELEALPARLSQIPLEKRQMLIIAGRHPNEGSMNIANRHHTYWEAEGALVIRLPPDLTPHHVWKKVVKLCNDGQESEALALAKKINQWQDLDVHAFLERQGIHAPVIDLHGSDDDRGRKLITLVTNNPKITNEIKKLNFNKVNTTQFDGAIPINHFIVEHWYRSTRFYGPHRKSKARYKGISDLPSNISSNALTGQMRSTYLFEPTIAREDLLDTSEFNRKFMAILRVIREAHWN